MVALADPPPETVNVAVTLDGALVAMPTCNVMVLKLLPGAREVLIVQVSELRVQVHPVPVNDPGVSEEARAIVTVTVPDVAAVPLLETVIV